MAAHPQVRLSLRSPFEQARAIFAPFDAMDVAALSALMTDDVRLQIGNTEAVTGKAAFEQSLDAFFGSVAGFRHSVVEVWSDGEALITELEVRYTRIDGSSITLPCCNVFRLRDGLVADYRVYMDINPVYE
jgi:limonene-1,2-epoxide hydrolase